MPKEAVYRLARYYLYSLLGSVCLFVIQFGHFFQEGGLRVCIVRIK